MKKLLMIGTAVVAVVCGQAFGSVIDDAKFKLDLRGDPNGNAYIDSGEVGNAFDYSAASPVSAVYGGGNGKSDISAGQYATYGTDKYGRLPLVESASVVNPLMPATSKTLNCIRFYQDQSASDNTKWAENGIRISDAAVQPGSDGRVTIYARFKWDGSTTSPNHLVGNGWTGTYNGRNGQSIYLDAEGKIGVVVSNNMSSTATKAVKLSKNVWNDVFVTTHNETVGGVQKAVSEISICQSDSLSISKISITNIYAMHFSGDAVSIGCYLLNSSGYHVPSSSSPRAFRGSVADVMIWDRALTDDEKIEVMTGVMRGGEWQIGAVNNSADEFGDSNPAAVFEPQTMPWHRMRKTLDASNTSLSIATTMTSSEHQMSRALSFIPILTGVTAPVEVSLNGTAVGEIDLASTTSITLPKALWKHDGTANTITVTRTAASSGTIQFDAISLAPAPTTTSVIDDAFFRLDLRGGASTYTKPGDIGNVFGFSSPSPLTGYMGDQRGPQTYTANHGNLPAQEMAAVQNPYYPYTTNAQNVLHFYQDKKSATASALTSIVIPGAAPQGSVQTFYLRFRWDGRTPGSTYNPSYVFQSGNAENGWRDQGVAMYISEGDISENLATTNGVVGVRGGTTSGDISNIKIVAGEWNDVFVTFEQNAGNTSCKATATLCRPKPNGSDFSPPSLVTQARTLAKPIVFNSGNLSIGGYYDSSTSATSTRAFRGLIADFMVWDRALTDEEKIEVMAGQHGAKWRVGAINGSADEFTDTDPAAVFEPQTMPWRQMRKTLDASHPTLALKSPLATFETGKAMILHVDPLFAGTPASVPVEVSVNGVVVDSFDLAETHNFIIPKSKWQRDGDGNVTVTLTRTETTGSVAIDAITLSGSWQITDDDGASNGMLNEKYSPRFTFAGDDTPKHFTSSLSVGSNAMSTNFTFGVWMPAGMSGTCGWKFRTKTTSRSNPIDGLAAQHTVYVNGKAVGTHDGWFAANEAFTLDIPAGTLHDGMNYVQWVQTLPTHAAQQAVEGKPGIYQFYDYWGMTLVPPPKYGTVILLR